MANHISVMLQEVLEIFNIVNKAGLYVDCTFGQGGHSAAILEKGAFVCCIDKDPTVEKHHNQLSQEQKQNSIFVPESFANLKLIKEKHFPNIAPNGILFDLGFSTNQLLEKDGFSYNLNTQLDMRYNSKSGISAKEWINQASQAQISQAFFQFSQERYSKEIAKEICLFRKEKTIETTLDLKNIINKAIGNNINYISIYSRIFQAIRIVVNNELEEVQKGIANAIEILNDGGILIAISFHSIEDKIVKNAFAPFPNFLVLPSLKECKENPKANCAKLRWMIK